MKIANVLSSVALFGIIAGAVAVPEKSAFAANMNYVGDWVATTTYAAGRTITFNNRLYYSLQSTKAAPNRGYQPDKFPYLWRPVGTIANTLLSGIGAPDNSIGQGGDFYIDTQNSRLFGPKNSVSGWAAEAVSLAGGAKGDTGAQGPAGPAGAQGPAGADGVAGAIGPAGAVGPAGAQGIAGNLALAGKSCALGEVMTGFNQAGDLLCVAITAQNLIVNGDFESPVIADKSYQILTQIPGWTLSYGTGFELVRDNYHYQGSQSVELDGLVNSGLQQSVTTVPNKPYQLSVYYSPRADRIDFTSGLEVYFNGVLLESISKTSPVGFSYQRYVWTVTPTTSISTIEFRAAGPSDSYGAEIDFVQFIAIPN